MLVLPRGLVYEIPSHLFLLVFKHLFVLVVVFVALVGIILCYLLRWLLLLWWELTCLFQTAFLAIFTCNSSGRLGVLECRLFLLWRSCSFLYFFLWFFFFARLSHLPQVWVSKDFVGRPYLFISLISLRGSSGLCVSVNNLVIVLWVFIQILLCVHLLLCHTFEWLIFQQVANIGLRLVHLASVLEVGVLGDLALRLLLLRLRFDGRSQGKLGCLVLHFSIIFASLLALHDTLQLVLWPLDSCRFLLLCACTWQLWLLVEEVRQVNLVSVG